LGVQKTCLSDSVAVRKTFKLVDIG
jgi:hypothetical protein